MKTAYYTLILLFSCWSITAQDLKITGTVSDASGPLPGANIVVQGTTNGTQSDFDGNYTLTVSKRDILVFSYVGYKTQKRKVKKAGVINVKLEEDSKSLDEIVIIGYGTQKRRDATGSVGLIASKKFNQSAIVSPQRLYTSVISNDVDNNSKNRQSQTSKAAKKEKLYIVDGVMIDPAFVGLIKDMPKKNIKETKVLKKKEATSFYGEQAVNGCIVITTKKGNYRIENEEAYARILENKFKHTALAPLSTFSIDVDKAGYSNLRRLINNGESIPFDAVKIEEMVNYFDYEYPQPKGKHPFAIQTDLAITPWNPDTQLVRIGLQGKKFENKDLPPSNLVFLIDVSGSMGSANKLPLLKAAFKLLANQLREQDRVSIVVYAGAAGVVLEPTSGTNKKVILEALEQLEAGGSTAGGEGIELAYDIAVKNFRKNGNNRVILATDGDFNVGASSDQAMETLIEEKRKSGVFLSVLGFGMGNYKDSKLETLADKGNGNHAYIDTMQEAQLIFGKEFGGTLFTIAKDVKIQVEFNPALVKGYRLIGYENRLLNDEDFIDDTKDAGELGSGHSVTALYEIIPVGVKSEYLKPVKDLKYSKMLNSGSSKELMTVKFRYKKPDGDKSIEMTHILKNEVKEMSNDFSFAAAVSLFGMHLRKSAFLNKAPADMIIRLADSARKEDKEGYRAEFIRLVKASNKL
ncbi:vWA domain-containing protein [Ascidiimonas sp. W6]|uniref:vWA domain-containing protein n=1 Tax=Ascidiimonas meishanensis TaxID=3128903 RepID=UPI0030EE769D